MKIGLKILVQQEFFIDGRLTAEQLQIYCVKYQDIERYRTEALFSDSDVPDAPCTMKQTSHVAAMIASYMVISLQII